jgi:molecular chaperone GrpE (heat shock protein)
MSFDLKWARFENLVTGMPGLLEELKGALERFGLRKISRA